MKVLSLPGRLNKLRAMSASEIADRIRYSAVLVRERRAHARGHLTTADRLQRSLRTDLSGRDWDQRFLNSRQASPNRFFPSIAERSAMRSLFSGSYRQEHDATVRAALMAREHRFAFFGLKFEYGADIDWQMDPVTRRRWPSLFHADVPVHGGDIGFGDVKHVWELSRQQFLVDLGKSWFLTANPEDGRAIERLIRSWIAGNPFATGVNWACALEPAFRIFSWLWTYHLAFDSLDRDFHLHWAEAFYDHARFLERHLELYSSPFNHLIAEATALYMIGACFPEFADAERWRARGRSVLEGRLDAQFYRDGGSVEQSTFYHHATTGFYLLAALLARTIGDDLSDRVWAALERAIAFSASLVQPDGTTPPVGGADDGKPIRLEHLPLWDFRPYQAVGAVLFNRPEFKHVAGRFFEDALWLLGPSGRDAFERMPSTSPQASIALEASGYHVLRSGWATTDDYVCFDCGEQAAGMRTDGVANSMHGHADCLSVILWLRGRRVLVDSGLFAYNCGGDWEAHFRETGAHNTAKIDGRDQAKHIRKMAWSHSYRASLESHGQDSAGAWVLGSHDGYARGPNGVRHRRAVWLHRDSYLVICDEFTGMGSHELTVIFQFAPGDLSMTGTSGAAFDSGIDLMWLGHDAWQATTACGGARPDEGWIAPSLGIRQAAPRLTLSCTTAAPRTTLLTVLASRVHGESRLGIVEAEGAGKLAGIRGSGCVDLIAASGVAPIAFATTDAPLTISRVYADGRIESSRAGGTRVSVNAGQARRLARFEPSEVGR